MNEDEEKSYSYNLDAISGGVSLGTIALIMASSGSGKSTWVEEKIGK